MSNKSTSYYDAVAQAERYKRSTKTIKRWHDDGKLPKWRKLPSGLRENPEKGRDAGDAWTEMVEEPAGWGMKRAPPVAPAGPLDDGILEDCSCPIFQSPPIHKCSPS